MRTAFAWQAFPFGFVVVVGGVPAGFWAAAHAASSSERRINRLMVHLWAITRGIMLPAVLNTARKNAARPMSV